MRPMRPRTPTARARAASRRVAAAFGPIVLVGLVVACGLAPGGTAVGALTGDPLVAPSTTLSGDGRTATDGVRTLAVSQVAGLDPGGQTIEVTGNGYDTFKGVYVAFCVVPPTNQLPSPCGGGADQSGTTGASTWISSNPPPQGVGLAVPYGDGGSFRATVDVSPTINASIDCRRVRCAVVTRNDHIRSTDRSQDIFVPITFADTPAVAPLDPNLWVAPPASEVTTTTSTAPPTTEAPTTTTTAMASTTTTSTVDPGDGDLAVAESDQPGGEVGGASTVGMVAAAGVAVALAATAGALVIRRRAGAGTG
jgi:hypothetical protein